MNNTKRIFTYPCFSLGSLRTSFIMLVSLIVWFLAARSRMSNSLLPRVVAAIGGGHCNQYRFLNVRHVSSLHEWHEYHDFSCGQYRVIGLPILYHSCPSCYKSALNHRVIGLSISYHIFSGQAAMGAKNK
jgi:hypothetical protein